MTASLDALPVHAYLLEEDAGALILLQRTSPLDAVEETWKISHGENSVPDKTGQWVYEPLPSSRTDEFYAATRWPCAEEALEAWKTYNRKE